VEELDASHQGALRNPPTEFLQMSLSDDEWDALVAFLLSLTEDYRRRVVFYEIYELKNQETKAQPMR